MSALKLAPFDPSNAKTYQALCHCGTVQYSVTLSPPLEQQNIVECNCSICSRNGYLLVYPEREHVKLSSGQEALKTYTFGPKMNLHHFCGRCGSAVFFDPQMPKRGRSPDIMGTNIRMFKDIKLKDFQTQQMDGWNLLPFVESDHLK
ncbi:hypothetical protein BU23DRAFT_254061 [Bimuria novae-zelandiae CBS 107.79]|uniref:CENP-V/GFA domain-containing protein n=1 Tax=Bimuria novae-zelandiae CBS 107.79 TaxID=1447943 RepID=A0A6A5VKN7_9PLEO|nr:hypothetical protein BU23DRAFT_254061 [Bimuria novae-zelandiae CBS 107.79]